MALKNELDARAMSARLADWLPSALGAQQVEITDLQMPSANGMSSETVLVNARVDGVEQGYVLRVAPAEGGLFRDYDLTREARVMTAVAEHSDAPVPRILAHESTGSVLGAEFLVMQRVYGEVPSDDPPYCTGGWVLELSTAQRATMYDDTLRSLSQVHSVDPLAAGLGDLRRPELGDTVIEQEFRYWRDWYAWANTLRPVPTIERAFELMAPTMPTDDGPLVVAWGDVRLGNMMFGPDQRVTGLFDWEMAALGRPEVDLAYLLVTDRLFTTGLGQPRPDGFPPRDQVIERYQELTGYRVRDLEWFEAFAALRGAIMIMRVGNRLIELGMMPPEADLPLVNPASNCLAELLGLPLPEGATGWIAGRS